MGISAAAVCIQLRDKTMDVILLVDRIGVPSTAVAWLTPLEQPVASRAFVRFYAGRSRLRGPVCSFILSGQAREGCPLIIAPGQSYHVLRLKWPAWRLLPYPSWLPAHPR